MNTSEQITELLHGELIDDKSVAELMHLLSVSPEKRKTFLEHVAISRHLLRSGGSIAPAPSAVEGVWNRITSLEPVPQTTATNSPTALQEPAEKESRWRRFGLVLLLLLAGMGSSYMLGSFNGEQRALKNVDRVLVPEQASQSSAQTGTPGTTAVDETLSVAVPNQATGTPGTTAVDEALSVAVPSQATETPATVAPIPVGQEERHTLSVQISNLIILLQQKDKKNSELQDEIDRLQAALLAANSNSKNPVDPTTLAQTQVATNHLQEDLTNASAIDSPVVSAEQIASTNAPKDPQSRAASTLPELQPSVDRRPWRIEMRQHIRSSLPTVNGLSGPGDIFSDRELATSLDLRVPMRLGVAVGKTAFSQVYHTNTGGALNDTIIEQAPSLFYGRAYIAPRIFEAKNFTASFELGLGGVEIGPIGTAGLNVEFQTTERVSLHGGISSWLLWTSYRNQLHTSTNLNAHFGVSLNP